MIVEPCDDNQLNRKLKSPFVFSEKFLATMHFPLTRVGDECRTYVGDIFEMLVTHLAIVVT